MRLLSPWLCLALWPFALGAADPVVKPDDLPRVPPTPPDKAAATFSVRPGFHVELMVAEPLIVSPVAMAFDEDGRLYVVEMIDYSERREEKLSRVKLLTDTNGDGRYDKASVFAEGLAWATAVTCWDGGVFVIASPDMIYFKDTDGDGRADVHALVATGFGNLQEKLNVQGLPNSLQWGPDQRIHGANGTNPSKLSNFARRNDPPLELRGRDFSFDPRDLQFRAEIGGGQWGMSFDNAGRKFGCANSRHLMQYLYGVSALAAGIPLPPAAVDIPVDGPQAEVYRTSPEEPWRVIRTQWRVSGTVKGAVEGGGRSSGYFTGAAGGMIYRGDAFPAAFSGNAFIADAGSNLIHRKVLSGEVQLKAQRAADEQRIEFASSRDNWMRPVSFANAPDGTLWFCDMQRETIEHPWSLPEPLKSNLDLNAGNDRGRLWRIVPDGVKTRALPKLGALSTAELVALLDHPNGWHRDTAARLLHQRQDKTAVTLLRDLAQKGATPLGRLTALRVLGSIHGFDDDVLKNALADTDADVRVQAVRSTVTRQRGQEPSESLSAALVLLAEDPSSFVRYEFAWALADLALAKKPELILKLAQRDAGELWPRTALLAAAADQAGELFRRCVQSGDPTEAAFAKALAGGIGARKRETEVDAVITQALTAPDPAVWLTPLADGLTRAGSSLAKADTGRKLQPLVASAEERLRIGGARPGDFTLLGLAGSANSAAAIATALESGAKPTVAALEALARLNPPTLGQLLTRVWPKLSPETRAAALRLWRSRPAQVPALLDAIASNVIAKTDLAAEDLTALRESKDAKVKERATALLGETAARAQAMAAFQPALTLTGSPEKGHATFQARCVICHRFRGEGQNVGPDLDASAAAGREKLMGNILEPSREITAGFGSGVVETKGGETIAGVIAAEADGALTLRLPGGLARQVAQTEVARIDRSPRSLMPDGLEAGLTAQDMADLLSFLEAKK
jgi:putative membrane-bound dehydrogenase-like protein